MAQWAKRHNGYKIGFCLLFLGGLFYVIGFGSPYWCSQKFSQHRSNIGLWMHCFTYRSQTVCDMSNLQRNFDMVWFRVVQVFQCIALTGIGLSCLFALYDNCIRKEPKHTRVLELLAGFSGIIGFTACMTYVGKMTDLFPYMQFSWGFGLDLTGCIFVIISTILILITNRAVANSNTDTSGTVNYPSNPQAQGGMAWQPGHSYPGAVIACPGATGVPPYQYPAGAAPVQYPAGAAPVQYPAGAAPVQYPAGAAPVQYPAGAAPVQYPAGAAPQYPPTVKPQGGYMAGVPPQAEHTGASQPYEYSGAPQEKGNIQ